MILNLNKNKKLSFYRKTEIYIGERDFDEIKVLLPSEVDGNEISDLLLKLHLVNNKGEYTHIALSKKIDGEVMVGSTMIVADLTNIAQDFFIYIEMIKGDNEVIGKTNVLKITINPLPDEKDRIIPKEEYEETIDELTEIIERNTEAMNRINGFEDGKSAYEIAVEHGYEGTEEEWLQSLNGKDGKSAYEIAVEHGYEGTEEQWLADMKDYDDLGHKPSINSVTLSGNKTSDDLHLQKKLTAGTNITIANDGTISAGGGVTSYNDLDNKPSINNIELSGNKTASDLGLQPQLSNYFTVENNEYIGYNFNSIRVGTNSILFCVPFERISNFPNNLVGKIRQSGTLYIFHYVHTLAGARYLIRRIMGRDLNGQYKEFAQYCSVADGSSFPVAQSDWVELTGSGSRIVSGVVNANGTITFTDSDGNTFTTTGFSVIGADGFSPVATVTQTASGATVSITDKNGTTTANISNGADGQDYVLTAQDKSDIADIVLSELPTTQGVLYGNTSN